MKRLSPQQIQQQQAQMAAAKGAGARPAQHRTAVDASNDRDAMLAEILENLQGLQDLQAAELAACSPEALEQFRRELSDNHNHAYSLPDPSRWHDAAHLYGRAIEALCRGEVAKGAQFFAAAVAEQDRVLAETSQAVDIDRQHRARPAPATVATGAAPRMPKPGAASIVGRILSIGPAADPQAVRRLYRRPAPEEALEDEEDEGEDS